jgi:hypothetical protein
MMEEENITSNIHKKTHANAILNDTETVRSVLSHRSVCKIR